MIPGLMPQVALRMPTLAQGQTLGNAATVGNPQAAPSPMEQLAALLAQQQQSQDRMEMGADMQGAEYINNSGSLGVLAALANKYMGGRIRRKEGEKATDLTQRILSAQTEAERAKLIEAERSKLMAEREKMAQRRKDAERLGINGEAANKYELTGDLPANGRTTPVWTNQGLMAFDPTSGTYAPAQMAGADGVPVSIDLDPNMSPEARAAAMGAIAQDMGGGVAQGATASAAMPSAPRGAPLAPYEKPAAAPAESDIERRIRLAREMGASDTEVRQMVIGREGAAAGAKPMPTAALKMIQEETNAANSAEAINTGIQKHLGRMNAGELDFGPVSNLVNEGLNFAGQSSKESRNYQEFKSDLERLRNDSLRLNSGVQTDGDAQRAWNELFANLNDPQYVRQRLQTIAALNQRARELRLRNVEMVKENYGRGEDAETVPAAPSVPQPSRPAPKRGGYTVGEVEQKLKDARAAIAQGAPKEAVQQRLREMGLTNVAGRL